VTNFLSRLRQIEVIKSAQRTYNAWIIMQRRLRQPAVDIGKLKCVGCGWCCAKRTCAPSPNEVRVIANFLDMSISKLVRSYMVGDMDPDTHVAYLRFANTGQRHLLGHFLPVVETYAMGQCVMRDDLEKVCKIHEVLPREGKDYKCWNEKSDYFKGPSTWKNGDLEKLVPWMKVLYGQ